MLKPRIVTAAFGIPLVVLIAYIGKWPLAVFIIGIVLLSLREFYQLASKTGYRPLTRWGYLGGVLFIALNYVPLEIGFIAILLWFLLTNAAFLVRFPRYSLADLGLTIMGTVYLGFLWSFPLSLRQQAGFLSLMSVFLLTWVADTAAYVVGRAWGRHKIAPQISPNKSWEGLAGAILLDTVVAMGLHHKGILPGSLTGSLLIGVAAPFLGLIGDLLESAWKRLAQQKDSSTLLPGHGGVLDRFDSLLWVAPLVFYWWKFH